MSAKIEYKREYIEKLLSDNGYILLSDGDAFYRKDTIICTDHDGYMYNATIGSLLDHKKRTVVCRENKFSIDNINLFLKKNNFQFECISEQYTSSREELEFVCLRCGQHIFRKWYNIRVCNGSYLAISCPNCDGRIESLHALVLKQMFKHNYPDTIEEEKSCVNPSTGWPLPTDIVNHRLRIAIEIQSQFHDAPERRPVDAYKKKFWEEQGYSFYAPDIRNYSVLEMCQLFFDIKELPDYINYEYSNKLNIKKAQSLIDSGLSFLEIAEKLNVKPTKNNKRVASREAYIP